MINKEWAFKILNLYFHSRTIYLDREELSGGVDELMKDRIIMPQDEQKVKINLKSDLFYEILLEYIENKSDRKLPQKVKEAFIWVEKFEEAQKAEYGYGNIINAYSEVIGPLKSYLLYLFHVRNKIEIGDFTKSLTDKEKWNYEEHILDVLLRVPKTTYELYYILSLLKKPGRITIFCYNLGLDSVEDAKRLYVYTRDRKNKDDFYIQANLLRGNFEHQPEWVLKEISILLPEQALLAGFVLGRLEYKNEAYIYEGIKLAESIGLDDKEARLQLPYFYKTIIENQYSSAMMKMRCFVKMRKLFSDGEEPLQNSVFNTCSLMEGYEQERYLLLIKTFIGKSKNYYKQIGKYFRTFKSCDYFFDLFIHLCWIRYKNKLGDMIDVSVFEEALAHFWNKDRIHTEKHLLELISHDLPCLRIAAVNLIRNKYLGFYEVDLTELDTELKQLRALEVLFYNCYFNLESFLPLILALRVSPFPEVVEYMQQKLGKLVFESYHDYLYEKVAALVKDEAFLGPVKRSLDAYHEMRKMKMAINDLNPAKNERDLMDLYYKLEHEEHQKMMHQVRDGENSFSSFAKQVIIVRGNSWKIGDNPVSLLGKVERSFVLDQKMFKDLDLFDYTHHYFESEF